MEEVDSIILHFLRQLNINIAEEIKSICELPVEIIIESAARCLIEINSSLKVTAKLPSGISHRIEVASQIASICKDLGYKNEVGYQTFLYYNEADLRQVFMFLIERLPSEGKQTNNRTLASSKKSSFLQEVSNKINEEFNTIWIPISCKGLQTKQTVGDYNQTEMKQHDVERIPISEDQLMKNLIKIKEIYNEKTLSYVQEPDTDKSISQCNPPKVEYEIHKSLKELKEEAIMLRQKLDCLESDKNVMDVEYSQAQKSCEKVEAEMKNIQNILESIGITEMQNEGAVENIMEKVQRNVCVLHTKSEEMTSKNLSLKIEIEKIKNSLATSESDRTKCKKILVNLKEEAKSMKEEYEKNEELRNQLKKVYEKCRGGNKRFIYTKRILEIISNVDKQNMEINKILEDTRQLQKEINSLEGQLDRCFSIADETLFRDAKKDDQAKKAYKLLALLHSECSTIVSLVNDTGTIARDIVDLEDNIKTEKAKKTEDTLKKIHFDLTKMQQESVKPNPKRRRFEAKNAYRTTTGTSSKKFISVKGFQRLSSTNQISTSTALDLKKSNDDFTPSTPKKSLYSYPNLSESFISPQEFRPALKAGQRKIKQGKRKAGKSLIATDTPEKKNLAEKKTLAAEKKKSKSKKTINVKAEEKVTTRNVKAIGKVTKKLFKHKDIKRQKKNASSSESSNDDQVTNFMQVDHHLVESLLKFRLTDEDEVVLKNDNLTLLYI